MQHSNRTSSQISLQDRKMMSDSSSRRKAETRTKIALGGLVLKSHLPDFLEIRPGDDLQLDPTKWEKTAVILGVLVEAYEKLQLDKEQDLYHQWEIIGRKLLRYDFKLKK